MFTDLTLKDVSARTGEPEKRLREWRSRGLLAAAEGDLFGVEDVERARLVQILLRRGLSIDAVARAARDGVLDRYMELLFPQGVGPAYSLAEAAEILGLDPALLRRVMASAGYAEGAEGLQEEDIEGLRSLRVAKDAGFPEEALMQAVRVYSDSLARVAEMESRLFHFYIHERLRAEGLTGSELDEATERAGNQVNAIMEPVILYFHRKGFQRAIREEAVMHLARQAGLVERGDVPGQMDRAISFVDLSSFTPLAEAMGDEKAAEVLERFSSLVREASTRWEGRVAKQIGDAFMLVFPDAPMAVACALEIEDRALLEPQFPAARSGVHWGSVLYRDGDYVGSSVNIASRVAAEAERHQVLVTESVRSEAKGLPGIEFVPLGKRRLKGLAEELVLFHARPEAGTAREKSIDPVCGMELGPDEVVARLSVEGSDLVFCSDDCLRRFVVSPERYAREGEKKESADAGA
jgi:class 3 adenylate cyclase